MHLITSCLLLMGVGSMVVDIQAPLFPGTHYRGCA